MPSTNWQEKTDPGEPQRFEAYAEQLRDLQRRRARKGPVARALHAKGQLGLEATFTVLPDLPAHARAGLFAAPAKFRACVRYSNGSGARQHDRKPDVRGIAVKVLGVGGKKLIPGLLFTADQTIPTETAPKLMITLGNPSVQMKVNGKTVPVAQRSPIGYQLTPGKTSPLPAGQLPTCT
jgi:hypothetical protein